MARRFLYVIAVLIVLVIAALFALRVWSEELAEMALAPTVEFSAQPPLADNAYASQDMWFSHPGIAATEDPSRWQPQGANGNDVGDGGDAPAFAVFFIHPTSYYHRNHWNAPLGDAASQEGARLFLRGMASAFGEAREIWAPRYRQATFGAFLAAPGQAQPALDLAYHDVEQAFEMFLLGADKDLPIVLAGHSQGSVHLLRLLRERIAGSEDEARIAMAYPIGWPVSLEHDLPALPFPACTDAAEARCIVAWSSFAEPAEPDGQLRRFSESPGFDGQVRGDGPILCVNPLTGTAGGTAAATANRGTLVPDADQLDGKLVPGAVPARCGEGGLLLIGDPPEMGPFVLPGNNYHVYDIPLFWKNLQLDAARRVRTWTEAQ